MKKITLMLCACAMAFAGLLVSCSNGSEKIVFTGETTYEYAYAVTGTKVETTTYSSNSDELVRTTTVTDSFKNGTALLSWTTDDDETLETQNYNLKVNYGYGDKTTDYSFSGSLYTANKAAYDTDSDYSMNSWLGQGSWDFYTLDSKYFVGTTNTWNADSLTADEEKELGKAQGDKTITVTGNIAEDDSLTIVVTVLNRSRDNATAKTLDNQTTVYTYNLVKLGSAE